MTNNAAEYEGLILGLEAEVRIFGHGHFHFHIGGDNQLILSQVTGEAACRAPNLIDLHKRALETGAKLASKDHSHVPRVHNGRADKLANQSMNTKASREWLNPKWEELTAVARPAVPSQSPPRPASSADPRPAPSDATHTSHTGASGSGRAGAPSTDSDAERPCSLLHGWPSEARGQTSTGGGRPSRPSSGPA